MNPSINNVAAGILKDAPRARCVLLCFLLAVPGCGESESPADEEKRAKIDALYNEYRPDFANAPELAVKDFDNLENPDEVVLVDVREPKEREVSILRGSLSKAEFEARVEEFKVMRRTDDGRRSPSVIAAGPRTTQ